MAAAFALSEWLQSSVGLAIAVGLCSTILGVVAGSVAAKALTPPTTISGRDREIVCRVAVTAFTLRQALVWPGKVALGRHFDNEQLIESHIAITTAAAEIPVFGTPALNEAANALVAASADMVDGIVHLRRTTQQPMSDRLVDERSRPEFERLRMQLNTAILGYVRAARQELGVPGVYLPVM